jgi:UPF0755 protein
VKKLLGALLLVGLVAGGIAAVGAVRRALAPVSASAPETLFEVARGETLAGVARRLEAAGLVRDRRTFELLARWQGLGGALKAGEYRLAASMAPAAILEALAAGRVANWEVAVPEGFTAAQIASRLAAEGLAEEEAFLAVANDPASASQLGVEGESLEGYLFPETYRLPRGLPPLEIARTMVEQFHSTWREIAPGAAESGLSMREVVTLASIVEKETGVPAERPLIAAVFLNRLARGMRLETDPTVIYGIEDFDGNLRRVDLENAENPYNTYRIAGLPPGPIASPGAEALHAVVSPAESDHLFFVSRNDGTHVFSRTYAEHVAAVDRFQRRRSR